MPTAAQNNNIRRAMFILSLPPSLTLRNKSQTLAIRLQENPKKYSVDFGHEADCTFGGPIQPRERRILNELALCLQNPSVLRKFYLQSEHYQSSSFLYEIFFAA
jgi:hypothetical protein